MALKAAFLFFGTILISLQFCHVSCDPVEDGGITVDATSGRLSFECSRTYKDIKDIKEINDYKCKFQLSNGIFIEYKSKNNGEKVNVNSTVKYQISHPASTEVKDGKKICKIEVDPPFEELEKSNSWKCWITTRDNIFGNYLVKPLNTTIKNISPIISSNTVYVKHADSFMVGCQVMQPIDSCYLKSPNGTTFTVTNSDIIPTYPGTEKMNLDMENYINRLYSSKNPVRTLIPAIHNNFSMGDCFTIFPNAGKSHEGDWTCQLRLNTTKKEITTKVSVIIKESYLMPSYTKNNEIKTLNCTAIPTLPSKINFCQWILRNDSGTYVNTDWNVKTLYNDTSCVINLPDSNGPYKGKWSCSVYFKNDFGDIFHTSNFIEVSSSTTSLPTLINIILLSIFSVFYYVYTC